MIHDLSYLHENVLLNTDDRKTREVVSKGEIPLSISGPGFKSDRVHFEQAGRGTINKWIF